MRQPHEASRHLIRSFEAKALKKRSLAVRFADDLTSLFGSGIFLGINVGLFIFWILANTGKIHGIPKFDSFPYPMLTTVVSLEAIILTIIVLMSQNRQSLISSMREEMDIQINLIAEREITKILKLLKEYLKVKGINLDDHELDEMLKVVDESYIERKLEAQLTNKDPFAKLEQGVEKVTEPIIKFEKGIKKSILK